VCQRLFYLESGYYIEEDAASADIDGAAIPHEAEVAQEHATANALVVSLHVLAGIHTENTMLLPVLI
jgi:hypothetical protein